MQTTEVVFVMNAYGGRAALVTLLGINLLALGIWMKASIVLLCDIHADHAPRRLERQKNKHKD
ncbi:hypothetical protein [Castellaniella sp. S9]|uniref:hypothetical protein n=1 Tax=Castellaniella sp. S9 TaxID=2993652 RepID=UPI0022B42702|nr:hypothetical protein [Castellaniella sp. S9]